MLCNSSLNNIYVLDELMQRCYFCSAECYSDKFSVIMFSVCGRREREDKAATGGEDVAARKDLGEKGFVSACVLFSVAEKGFGCFR